MNEWRSVLGQEPGNTEARLGLARAAVKAGDRAAAAQEYFRILQIVPDQREARRELARLGRPGGLCGRASRDAPSAGGPGARSTHGQD
jgi:predicted TPR repeat methyltransferase